MTFTMALLSRNRRLFIALPSHHATVYFRCREEVAAR